MNVAVIWVGHIRTFHKVWPSLTVANVLEPMGSTNVRHFFYTTSETQNQRNRPNDPPSDYSYSDALRYVRLSLKPEALVATEASHRVKEAVATVRAARAEVDGEWRNIEALTQQYVKRTEAWEHFVRLVPSWTTDFDAIVFNRPDVFLYDRLKLNNSVPFKTDDVHVFTSLGPTKDEKGLDDRWAVGHPRAIERYMRVGDSVVEQYAVEKRSWWPEEVNRRHADRSGLRIVKATYQAWPPWAPAHERDHVGIMRFEPNDGRTLRAALRGFVDGE